ncbi:MULTISPECIES: outer-membrane lipoprotein carrier protein LolA [unclassified Psychrobacillus]|uniref:LolA family protein n=1 Tax=unclassified Psychrobacillus TaxID=2636677 RepID=UPI00146DCD53|nr:MULTISPECIES: outer-membrane lipoprotein carrier protein LolA [unclassified Psychrobacillus]MCM3357636.1 outer-membrane lipoprotein carrier protein LolA [Psychrobacillus sp. MER TA 171]NME07273.1 outer membrane lipoprotein carrier protein LolA [Psychrobacillus sp. BL-248-WT-3]
MKSLVARLVVLFAMILVLSACGAESKEDVVKKLSNKWSDAKGYELTAEMSILTGAEPRVYDVEVWHTKPDFYRVKVSDANAENTQMIVRNAEGVFVVTPALNKTYKFQSKWPSENSQAYLIGSLAEDIKKDKAATFKEEGNKYVFEAKTTNNHKNMLPTQKIYIDKKTMLPTDVSILNENQEEQIHIKFDKVSLGKTRAAGDYKIEQTPAAQAEGNTVEASAELENRDFETHYPVIKWEDTHLMEEKVIQLENQKRVVLTFSGGDKDFTVIQQLSDASMPSTIPVFAPGDPVDLGVAIGAVTDQSISWEQDGMSFFIASSSLTKEEMIEVAASMTVTELK